MSQSQCGRSTSQSGYQMCIRDSLNYDQKQQLKTKRLLAAQGFYEASTLAFYSNAELDMLHIPCLLYTSSGAQQLFGYDSAGLQAAAAQHRTRPRLLPGGQAAVVH